MKKYIVDTHALVWFLDNDPRLGINAARILENPNSNLIIPTIVLAELKYLHAKRRFDISLEQTVEKIETSNNIIIYPLDLTVVAQIPVQLNIHDGIIAATALTFAKNSLLEIIVITKDNEIGSCELVKTVW